jgi:KDO2-lipid IV(A) lauroyltransferase
VLLYRVVAGTAALLPLWLLQGAGRATGAAYFLLSSRRRRIALANLARVFPGWTAGRRWRTGLACGAHFGRIALDYLKWSRVPAPFIRRKVRLEGLEHVEAAKARGRGVFILSAHFGHWEVAALALSLEGYPQAMVHRPLDNPGLEAALSARRTRFGNTLVPKHGALKGMLKALRSGGLVDILIDQKSADEVSHTVPFLGVPTPTVASLARLVAATGAAVVPLFAVPDGTGYRVELRAPMTLGEGETEEAFTARCNAVLSEAIFAHPPLWLWFHNRWRI